MCTRRRALGLSLIEVIVFIVVLGIGLAGIVTLYAALTKASVDPVVRVQALAIARSLLDEVELQPFTYCDPDDPAVYTATSAADCAVPEAMGPEAGETRYADPRFDNVNDYDGFSMSGAGMRDISGAPLPGLSAYSASVSETTLASGELPDVSPLSAGLRITVTVTGPAGVRVVLQGYRLRYAPDTP